MSFLHSNYLLSICNLKKSEEDLQLSFVIKIIVLFCLLGWCIIFQFSFQLRMLCTASAPIETCSPITSALLVKVWCNVNPTKNNPNSSRKVESLCPLSRAKTSTAATSDMMFCETGHMKILKKETFCLHVVQLQFFPIKWASKILPGQVCHLAY